MEWSESTEVARRKEREPVRQFSVFMPNRLGRLNEVMRKFDDAGIHALALTVLDTTDSTILRLIVDDPDAARAMFKEMGAAFTETKVLVVELDYAHQLKDALSALVEAELNIHYIYPFLTRPDGKAALAISIEHPEVAEEALRRHDFPILDQHDLSR
jgi:hypothetical protein